MTDIAYHSRHTRDMLHASRTKITSLREALQSARNETIARGGSEVQFARACGLTLEELQELIGSYRDFQLFKESTHDGR